METGTLNIGCCMTVSDITCYTTKPALKWADVEGHILAFVFIQAEMDRL